MESNSPKTHLLQLPVPASPGQMHFVLDLLQYAHAWDERSLLFETRESAIRQSVGDIARMVGGAIDDDVKYGYGTSDLWVTRSVGQILCNGPHRIENFWDT